MEAQVENNVKKKNKETKNRKEKKRICTELNH